MNKILKDIGLGVILALTVFFFATGGDVERGTDGSLSITTAAIAVPAAYEDIKDYGEKPVRLMVDQGTLMKLSKPISTVFVADATIADVQVKTPTLIYIYGRLPGTTNLYAVDENENVIVNRKVTIAFETHRLQSAMNQMLPQADIKVKSLNNTVVLRGDVRNASDAADAVAFAQRFVGSGNSVINQLKITGANQVNLQVTIAEISRSSLKDLGVNWDVASTIGNFVFGLATGSPTTAAGSFLTRTGGTNNLGVGFQGNNSSVSALIDALEQEGLIQVMAKPNLTALSGETASFLSGGEFPVPVAQEDNRISIEFREFGVSLAFTPTILDDNRISLRVRPEVSQLSNTGAFNDGNLNVPALSTRRAETTVEMGSGQSFAIAGLLQQRIAQDNTTVPGLGDITGVSALFSSDNMAKQETELVILVTPYVVQPTNAKLSKPNDGYVPPKDSDRYLRRETHRQPLRKPQADIMKPILSTNKSSGFQLN